MNYINSTAVHNYQKRKRISDIHSTIAKSANKYGQAYGFSKNEIDEIIQDCYNDFVKLYQSSIS